MTARKNKIYLKDSGPPNRINWGIIFRSFFLIVVFAGIIYLIFWSKFFQVEKIEIRNTILIDKSEVQELVEAKVNQQANTLLFPSQALEQEIKKQFSLADDVSVQKGLPDTVRVIVHERGPAIIWQTLGQEYLIDQNGVVFSKRSDYQAKAGEEKEYLPTIRDQADLPIEINQKIAARSWINFINQIDQLLIKKTDLKAKKFSIQGTTFDLFLTTNKGRLFLDTSRSAKEQIDSLVIVLDNIKKKKFQYIDLRIKGWVYYK